MTEQPVTRQPVGIPVGADQKLTADDPMTARIEQLVAEGTPEPSEEALAAVAEEVDVPDEDYSPDASQ